MQRNETSHATKRLLTGSALVATLAFSGLSLAEGNKAAAETGKHADAAKVHRTPGIAALSRDQIKDLQRELAARGLYQGSIDGVPGEKTEAALRNFQTQQGLAVGALDAKTRDALGLEWNQASSDERRPMAGKDAQAAQKQPVRGTDAAPAEHRSVARDDSQPSPRSEPSSTGTEFGSLGTERVKQMQQRLQREGYYQGEIDGVPGAQTRAALKRYFQRQAQLVDQDRVSDSAIAWFATK